MHSDFRLNGVSYDRNRLLSYANEFCNKKQEYLRELGLFILDWYSEKPDILLQTSGSTGKPTQILASKTMMSTSAMTTIKNSICNLNRRPLCVCLLGILQER